MIGLLLKDLFSMRKQVAVMGGLVIFYILFGFVLKQPAMVSGMMVALFIGIPLGLMSYDETSKWDRYALSMPISKKVLIGSKYVISLIFLTVSLLVMFAVNFLSVAIFPDKMTPEDACMLSLAVMGAGMLYTSIMLPVIYQFGIERSRFLMIVVFAVPLILYFVLSKAGVGRPSLDTLKTLAYLAPVLMIPVFVLSACLSLFIALRKEY